MSICQIYDLCAETLWLGRYGENGARDIAIDVGRWFADLGTEGTVVLVNWRPGEDDTPYNPNVTMDGSRVVWSPSSIDLAISGRGFAELRYYVGNALAKSKTFRTVIDRTPSEGANPPSAAEDWVERMEDAAVTAQTASETAVSAAETATEGAQAVAQALPTVTQAAQTASSAATTATNAATEAAASEEVASAAANAAQTASETATAASQTAVGSASTATTKAEQAVEAAGTATTKASEATQAATTATANAQTSTAKAGEATTAAATATSKATEATTAASTASAAATTATGAASTATSAASTATAAKTAAQTAQTGAETAQTAAESAAASVSASAAQIATNTSDISAIKADFSDLENAFDTEKIYGADVEYLTLNENTYSGLTVSKDGNGYKITGTSTGTLNNTIGTIPQEIGKTYRFKKNASNAPASSHIYLFGVSGRPTSWVEDDEVTWVATSTANVNIRINGPSNTVWNATFIPILLTNASNAELTDTVNDVESNLNGLIAYTPKDIMEYGNINFAYSPPWYTNSKSRIRTFSEKSIPLEIGDVITLSGNNVMYVGWTTDGSTWKSQGWISEGSFTVSEKGDYQLLVRYSTEATITDTADLISKIVIYRHDSVYDGISGRIQLNKRRDWAVKSINHRGYSRVAPENTLPAFKLSDYLGFEYVETDVRFTSDGVPVLLHDATINRTARNADGTELPSTVNIADITYEQALTYDFGIWMGAQYSGTKIPTFDEFMLLCRNLSLKPYIEIKDETGDRVAQIVNIAKKYGIIDRCTWIAFSYTALQKVTAVHPSARLGLVSVSTISILDTLKNTENEVFTSLPTNSITDTVVNELITAGYPLECYTPNGIESVTSMNPYVSGMTSDYVIAGEVLHEENALEHLT